MPRFVVKKGGNSHVHKLWFVPPIYFHGPGGGQKMHPNPFSELFEMLMGGSTESLEEMLAARQGKPDPDPVVKDYMKLNLQLRRDIQAAVSAGVVSAMREVFSDRQNDKTQIQLAKIMATAFMAFWTNNWVYRVYRLVKFVVSTLLALIALLLVVVLAKVVFPVVWVILFLVLFVPGFLFGWLFNRRIRMYAANKYLRHKLYEDIKGIRSREDAVAAAERYERRSQNNVPWRVVRRTLPRSLQAGTSFAGWLQTWRRWGPSLADHFWGWFYGSNFLERLWPNRVEQIDRFEDWLVSNRLSTWIRGQKSRWEQSRHPVDTSVIYEGSDYLREQASQGPAAGFVPCGDLPEEDPEDPGSLDDPANWLRQDLL